tara:strand:+ start:768 stop:890 length:123 start_codon:yes stop_codon:yes gene_type:complete
MDVLIGAVVVAIIAVVVLKKVKPDLYAKIKEKASSLFSLV